MCQTYKAQKRHDKRAMSAMLPRKQIITTDAAAVHSPSASRHQDIMVQTHPLCWPYLFAYCSENLRIISRLLESTSGSAGVGDGAEMELGGARSRKRA